MIEQLVARVFTTRNLAHLAHWKTKSYAQHMALGSFYDALIEHIDSIVEAYQGAFDLIAAVPLGAPPKPELIAHLTEEWKWIAKNREQISKGDTSLQNQLDSLVETYQTTLYKLKKLS
jgi:DNA-binding ferritin-like protein